MKLRHHGVDILLLVSGLISLGLSLTLSKDLRFYDAGVNLSAGYSTSVLFYFMLVWAPNRARKKRVKNGIISHYRTFKEDVLRELMSAGGWGYSTDEIDALMDAQKFEEFFKGHHSEHQSRWDNVMNGLDAYHVSQIAMHLELLRSEVQYVLDAVEVEDEELFKFMKRLSSISYAMSKRTAEYDDVKAWGRFLWGIYTLWDPVVGELDKDPILKALEDL